MNKKVKNMTAAFILVASGFMMAHGIYKGEIVSILNKSIHICLECIGIG